MSYQSPSRRHASRLSTSVRLGVIAVAACFLAAPVLSNPVNPTVVNGAVTFNQVGNVLSVTNSNGAIINWDKFSIKAGETTHFAQTAASSSVLNRVLNDPTAIYGTLSSNGRVWLVNPAGILVGPGGRVDTAGFVASTLNIRNEDFLAGRKLFINDSNAKDVINQGEIRTPAGGSVYLIGSNVSNEGIITTPNGETILAAGATVSLIDSATPGVKVDITGAAGNATNLGTITAEAGRIGIAGVIVRNSGMLNASSVVSEGGRIFLKASQDAYVDGNGRIVTTGTKGGSVEVLGNRVAVMDNAEIDVSGANGGGSIKIGGDYQGKNPDIQNASITWFGPNASLKADATEVGAGGTVIVWADDTTQAHGTISARGGAAGGNGGFVETSGKHRLDVNGIRVDTAGGNWLLDPNDFTIAASGGDISGTDLSTNLATNNVTILSSDGATSGSGDIFVNDSVAWSSDFGLTLSAYRNIEVNQTISGGLNSTVVLRADNTGSGIGTVNFGGGGSAMVGTGGQLHLYYNPASYSAPTDYSSKLGGSYTTGMLVNSADNLQSMNSNVAGSYALGKDVDASATSGWNSGAGFQPVGDSSTNFTGTFDGLSHTITGLTIYRPTTDNVGLFGYANGATIRNLGLTSTTITGKAFVGSLAGRMDGNISNIDNSYSASAVITGLGSNFVGGLVGWIRGNISNSYSTGTATGIGATGGLTGGNQFGQSSISNSYSSMIVSGGAAGGLVGGNDGIISTSYSTGTVTGSSYAGGLVGQNHGGTIIDSYSTSPVYGGASAGGLVGLAGPNDGYVTTITNSYSTGLVSGGGSAVVGGLVGVNLNGISTITGSYWDIETSGQLTSGGGVGTGLTTAQMQTAATFTAWSADFWNIADGAYPTLKNMPAPPAPLCVGYDNCWTGAVNSLWAAAGNWSAGHVPAGAETVKMDVTGTPTITLSGINPSFGSLWLAENLDVDAGVTFALNNLFTLTSGTATFNGTASVHTYSQTGGTLAGNGAFTVTNSFASTGGTINRTGALNITHNGNLQLGLITTTGALSITATGAIYDNNGSALNLKAGTISLTSVHGGSAGELAISADVEAGSSITATVDAAASNGGISIRNTGATQPFYVSLSDNAAANSTVSFTHTGSDLTLGDGYHYFSTSGGSGGIGSISVAAPSSTLTYAYYGGGLSGHDIILAAGNNLNLNGGLYTSGNVGLDAGTLNLNGQVAAYGQLKFNLGNVSAGYGGSLSAYGPTSNITGIVSGDIVLDKAYFSAGNDVALTFTGATSTIALSNGGHVLANSPSTIYLKFLARSSGGVMIDGVETTRSVPGGSGLFVVNTSTPAIEGAGLDLAYANANSNSVVTDPCAVSPDLCRPPPPNALPTPQPDAGSISDYIADCDQGSFGCDEDNQDKKKPDEANDGKKDEAPAKKKVAQCWL